MTFTPAHKPAGAPDGGQFTAPAHSEPDLGLAARSEDILFDSDGTEWDWAELGASVLEAGEVNSLGILVDTAATDDGHFVYDVLDYDSGRKIHHGEAATLSAAKEAAKDARYNLARYNQGFHRLRTGDRTMWGLAETVDRIAPGLDIIVAGEEGGYRLSEERNNDIDPHWRRSSGCYGKEDDWAVVVITHRDAFADQHVRHAHETGRRQFPEQYMRVVGKNPAKYGVTDFRPVISS